MDKIAKAITAGAGAAFAGYTGAQSSGHLSWLTLVGCLCGGVLVGAITWATPNAPAGPSEGVIK